MQTLNQEYAARVLVQRVLIDMVIEYVEYAETNGLRWQDMSRGQRSRRASEMLDAPAAELSGHAQTFATRISVACTDAGDTICPEYHDGEIMREYLDRIVNAAWGEVGSTALRDLLADL